MECILNPKNKVTHSSLTTSVQSQNDELMPTSNEPNKSLGISPNTWQELEELIKFSSWTTSFRSKAPAEIFVMRTFDNLQYLYLTTYRIYSQQNLICPLRKDNVQQQNTSLHSSLNQHLNILYFGCPNFFTTQVYVNAFIHELTTTAVCIFLSILNPALSTMTLHESDYQHHHADLKPNCSGTTCVAKSSWWLTHAPKTIQ